jgi:ABC-type Zn uptake system ZnuABC Zn-binding protein ZnuA
MPRWEREMRELKGVAFVGYHDSWSYFADWTGMIVAGTLEPKPGIPPQAEDVNRVIELIRKKKVRWLAVEPYYPQRIAQHIETETGARRVNLPAEGSGSEGYFDFIDRLLKKWGDAVHPPEPPVVEPSPQASTAPVAK